MGGTCVCLLNSHLGGPGVSFLKSRPGGPVFCFFFKSRQGGPVSFFFFLNHASGSWCLFLFHSCLWAGVFLLLNLHFGAPFFVVVEFTPVVPGVFSWEITPGRPSPGVLFSLFTQRLGVTPNKRSPKV